VVPLLHSSRRRLALVAALAGLALTACAGGDGGAAPPTGPAPTSPGATVVPAPRPDGEAPPGTLIEAVPIDAPDGAVAWRITYHSRTRTDDDIAVTGLVVAPDTPAGAEGRPVLGWGHPTTGTADACAPSADGAAEVPVGADALAAGWTVVVTDYEGLGAEGPHPYLVGASEGHAVLDAIRAAAQVERSGVTSTSPVLLGGFSQGGHAALFAAELAPTYAPDLDVRAVAVVAPVGDPRQFWDRAAERDDQVGVAATMAYGLSAAYPELDPADVLTDQAVESLGLLETTCIGEVVDAFMGPVDDVVRRSPDDADGWAEALAENTAGRVPLGLPVLLLQGDRDDIVYPASGDALAARLCRHGDPVEYRQVPGADHGDIPPATAIEWLAERLAGTPATSTC
jgi:dipeptidyl aminopeptidase/acylaminoacyl peptidase